VYRAWCFRLTVCLVFAFLPSSFLFLLIPANFLRFQLVPEYRTLYLVYYAILPNFCRKTIILREIYLIDISKNLSILVFFYSFIISTLLRLKNARGGERIFLTYIWKWKNNILFIHILLGVFYLMVVDWLTGECLLLRFENDMSVS